jgi:hypothetical protein
MLSYEATDYERWKKFIVDVYNRVFDTILESMENRFTINKEKLIDLS